MPDTLTDNILDRARLEPIDRGSLPRIVDEGNAVWLRVYVKGRDCEVRLTPGALGALLQDGLAALLRMGGEVTTD